MLLIVLFIVNALGQVFLLRILYRIGFLQLTYQRMFDSQALDCGTVESDQISYVSDTNTKTTNPIRA